MGATIGAILASAVGVAISPVPIIAVILMLFSGAATRNSMSFLPGWVASIDDFTMGKSFGIGLLLAAVNPKNLGLTIAVASTISAAGLSSGDGRAVRRPRGQRAGRRHCDRGLVTPTGT